MMVRCERGGMKTRSWLTSGVNPSDMREKKAYVTTTRAKTL